MKNSKDKLSLIVLLIFFLGIGTYGVASEFLGEKQPVTTESQASEVTSEETEASQAETIIATETTVVTEATTETTKETEITKETEAAPIEADDVYVSVVYAPENTLFKSKGYTYLRDYPTWKAKITAELLPDSLVTVLAYCPDGWVQVKCGGEIYYTHTISLEKIEGKATGVIIAPVFVKSSLPNLNANIVTFVSDGNGKSYETLSQLDLRLKPDNNDPIACAILPGTPVNFEGVNEDGWAMMVYNGVNYFVNGTDQLAPAVSATPTPKPEKDDDNDKPKPTSKPKATPKPTNKPKATPKPTSKPKATATPKPESKPEEKPESKPEATATPKPETKPEDKPKATATPKPTATPVPEDTSTGKFNNTEAKKILDLVNQARTEAGLEKLKWSDSLAKAARTRAKELPKKFSHTRPNGSDWYTVSSKTYAENIAGGQRTAKEAFKAWMNSSGHKKNIMNPDYKTIGVGLYIDENGEYCYYWAQEFGY